MFKLIGTAAGKLLQKIFKRRRLQHLRRIRRRKRRLFFHWIARTVKKAVQAVVKVVKAVVKVVKAVAKAISAAVVYAGKAIVEGVKAIVVAAKKVFNWIFQFKIMHLGFDFTIGGQGKTLCVF